MQYRGHQSSPYAFLQPQIECGCDHMLIGFTGGAFERGWNTLGGDFLSVRVENGAHGGLAGHIAMLHAAHAIAENGQEASVSQEGVVFRVRQTYRILLVMASSDVLRVGGQVAHRKRSIIACLRGPKSRWSAVFRDLPSMSAGVRMGPVMGSLSPRLQVRVAQKQILTPGLVQMVSLLQLNRLELKDMISAEVAQNPVLEEAAEGGEELTPEELQPLLEAERDGRRSGRSIHPGSDGWTGRAGWSRGRFDPCRIVIRSMALLRAPRLDDPGADHGARRDRG